MLVYLRGEEKKRPQFIFQIFLFAHSSLLIWPTYSDLSRSIFFDNSWQLVTLLLKWKFFCCDGWNMENRWPLYNFQSICIQEDFILIQCYHHGYFWTMANTAGVAIVWKLNQNDIFLIVNEFFLIGNYTGAPVFHLPSIATQPKKIHKRVLGGQGPPKKVDLEWSLYVGQTSRSQDFRKNPKFLFAGRFSNNWSNQILMEIFVTFISNST